MDSSRKNFSQGYQSVNDNFQKSAANLFVKQHNGTKWSNAIFITILFCVLCPPKISNRSRFLENGEFSAP